MPPTNRDAPRVTRPIKHVTTRHAAVIIGVVAVVVGVAASGAFLSSRTFNDKESRASSAGSGPDEGRAPKTTHAKKCTPIPPRHLPDGTAAGSPRKGSEGLFIWGQGDNAVAQLVGADELNILTDSSAERLPGSRRDVRLISVGDPGVGEIAFAFREGQCKYTVWLSAGTGLKSARKYATRY